MHSMSVSEENKIIAELEDLFRSIDFNQINDLVSRKHSQMTEDEFLFYLSTACTKILGPEKGWVIAEGICDYDIRENAFFNIAYGCLHSGDTKNAIKFNLKMDRTGVMFETIAYSLIEKLI